LHLAVTFTMFLGAHMLWRDLIISDTCLSLKPAMMANPLVNLAPALG
jgi:hypothetical protein